MRAESIRVVVVDDHALFRSGLALLLELDRRISVVGEGGSGREAILLAQELSPDIMLLDVEMDRTSAESTIRQLNRSTPAVLVIVLTMHRDTVLKRQLLSAGAIDYVTKDMAGIELAEVLIRVFRQGRSSTRPAGEYEYENVKSLLSERELQVLRMIAQARSNREIGNQLSIAEGTVKRHTTNIYGKLGATSRIDAVRKAGRLGLFLNS
jgi:DNA-binding NarL/FixJ family response regulator